MTQQQQALMGLQATIVQVAAIVAATVIALHNDAGYTQVVLVALASVIGGSSLVAATGHVAQAMTARALALGEVAQGHAPGGGAAATGGGGHA